MPNQLSTGTEQVSLVLREGVSSVSEWDHAPKIPNEPQDSWGEILGRLFSSS